MIRSIVSGCIVTLAFVWPAVAADPGKAVGSATIDGTTTPLAFAVETRKENLFDEKKQDTVVVLTDRPLAATKPDDEVELSMRARRGELLVFAVRLDGTRIVNVTVSHKGLSGLVILPAGWFQYSASKADAGILKLPKRDYEGHSYALDVEFAAAPFVPARQTAAPPAPPAAAKAAAIPAAAPATISNLDRTQVTAILIQALMQHDANRAMEIIKLGVDPNGRDESGIPVLNWAVMMCQPPIVKALIDAKADLKYERAPGMTILTEAGACPEAARMLRAAGAR